MNWWWVFWNSNMGRGYGDHFILSFDTYSPIPFTNSQSAVSMKFHELASTNPPILWVLAFTGIVEVRIHQWNLFENFPCTTWLQKTCGQVIEMEKWRCFQSNRASEIWISSGNQWLVDVIDSWTSCLPATLLEWTCAEPKVEMLRWNQLCTSIDHFETVSPSYKSTTQNILSCLRSAFTVLLHWCRFRVSETVLWMKTSSEDKVCEFLLMEGLINNMKICENPAS